MNPFQNAYSNLGNFGSGIGSGVGRTIIPGASGVGREIRDPMTPEEAAKLPSSYEPSPMPTYQAPLPGHDASGQLQPGWAYRDYDISGNPIRESAYELQKPAKPQEFSGGGGGGRGGKGGDISNEATDRALKDQQAMFQKGASLLGPTFGAEFSKTQKELQELEAKNIAQKALKGLEASKIYEKYGYAIGSPENEAVAAGARDPYNPLLKGWRPTVF